MRQAYLVYNPAAGRYPSGLLAERAAQVLRRHGWEIKLEQTHDGEHITRLAHQASQEGWDAFFVVGGDGSINLAINGLVGSQTALGVLPAGTANVWAQELGLPGLTWTRWMALEESAERLAGGEVRQVDVGFCNNRAFLLWAGVGLDAFIVHRIEPRGRWEKHFAAVQYAASAVWNAGFWRGQNLRVSADGQEVTGHYLLALVSNIHLYAGGLAELTPDARLDDNLMDLWLFEGDTMGDTVQIAWDLWSGRHTQSDQVIRYPFRSLTIESDAPLYMQVDGEPVLNTGPAEIEVRPKLLNVLVPRQTPHLLFSNTS